MLADGWMSLASHGQKPGTLKHPTGHRAGPHGRFIPPSLTQWCLRGEALDQTQASEPGIMRCDGKGKSTSYTDLLCLGFLRQET